MGRIRKLNPIALGCGMLDLKRYTILILGLF